MLNTSNNCSLSPVMTVHFGRNYALGVLNISVFDGKSVHTARVSKQ